MTTTTTTTETSTIPETALATEPASAPSVRPRSQVALHWITAALIGALAILGFVMTDLDPGSAARLWMSRAHAVLGVATGLVLVARIVVRVRGPRIAPLPMSAPRRLLMRTVHAALYVAILAVLLSGMGTSLLGDWSAYLLGGGPAPDLHAIPPRAGHELFAFALFALVATHAAGVLAHELRHGGALRRIL